MENKNMAAPEKAPEINVKEVLESGKAKARTKVDQVKDELMDNILPFDPKNKEIGIIKDQIANEVLENKAKHLVTSGGGITVDPRGFSTPGEEVKRGGRDRTGGGKKRWTTGQRLTAGVTAFFVGLGTGYAIFHDQVNGFFNNLFGGETPGYIPPKKPIESPGVMPSQSSEIPGVSVSPSPSQSPENSVVVPEVSPSETQKTSERILDQKIVDFLDFENDFTKEKMKQLVITANSSSKETRLGIFDGDTKAQGYLFDYVEKDGSLLLIVGFDARDEGKRFVTGLEIPVYVFEMFPETGFMFTQLSDKRAQTNYHVVDKSGDKDKILGFLEKLKGKSIVFWFDTVQTPESEYSKYDGKKLEFFKEYQRKVPISRKLLDSVATNKIKLDSLGSYGDVKLVEINSSEDIDKFKITDAPSIGGIYFNSSNE